MPPRQPEKFGHPPCHARSQWAKQQVRDYSHETLSPPAFPLGRQTPRLLLKRERALCLQASPVTAVLLDAASLLEAAKGADWDDCLPWPQAAPPKPASTGTSATRAPAARLSSSGTCLTSASRSCHWVFVRARVCPLWVQCPPELGDRSENVTSPKIKGHEMDKISRFYKHAVFRNGV